ncbi:MAG: hypothetical protein M3506_07485 [Chloroflexota bacterium]|nr:hypothetical protein [Chloroflexota bacterium]
MTTETMRCARHPDQETNLQCARCGKSICPKCMVYTSVGLRCPECARERRSGINAPSQSNVLRAAAVAGVVALVLGTVWGLFPAYGFWIALLLGFGGGELVNNAANRRRGPELQSVAAGMVIGAFILASVLSYLLERNFSDQLIFQTIMAGIAMFLATVRQK